jgi:hypothetical protein
MKTVRDRKSKISKKSTPPSEDYGDFTHLFLGVVMLNLSTEAARNTEPFLWRPGIWLPVTKLDTLPTKNLMIRIAVSGLIIKSLQQVI